MRWQMVALVVVATIATSCGALSGNDTDADEGLSVDLSPAPAATTDPDVQTATPVDAPESTVVLEPTDFPAPTPTPSVVDSYVTLVNDVRAVFTATDKAAAIEALVPAPISLSIPPDADLQRLDLEYDRWDLWESVTGNFAPVDRSAAVLIEYRFLTTVGIDEMAEAYREPLLAAGFEITVDDSESGVFADTQYLLNGGFFRPGRGGTARLIAIQQGDMNLVEFEINTELDADSQPSLTAWPTMFPVPFAGGFTSFSMFAVSTDAGVEVSTTTSWTLSATVTDRRQVLETLMAEYPTETITLDGDIAQAGENSVAVTTFVHPTGAAGSISVDLAFDATIFEFRLVSLPG